MSNVIETRAPENGSHVADRPPRPALRDAWQQIALIAWNDETAVLTDRSIEFQNAGQRTTISTAPLDVDTVDGNRITDIITIRTPLTAFGNFNEDNYSLINVFATTGAIVRCADGEYAVISRLPLFEGDDEALRVLYAPLIADAARLQVIGPYCGYYHCQGRKDEYDAAALAIPGWDEPSYWGADEFEYAKERLRARGAYANAGPAGFTVEFPWGQGAVSSMVGDCTSLLQIRADTPHPAAGNGLFCRLDVPTAFASEEEVLRCAADLNRREAAAIDAPPFFGAWCSNGRLNTLSYVSFWPNLLYREGTVATIAFWSWARSRFARQVIGNL